VSLLTQNLSQFMAEPNITERAKIECYLLVVLGVRKAGLIMVPAEIPGLEGVGPEIDNEFYWRTTGRRDPNKPYAEFLSLRLHDTVKRFGKKSVPYKIELLREIFDRAVLTTIPYKSHLEWAHRIGLSYRVEEVRPSIREIWVYKDADTGLEIERLSQLRKQLRFKAIRSPRASAPAYYRVFPEEASAEFVRGVGELLGYPASCLNKYVADRAAGDISVEMRASSQLAEHKLAGKTPVPEAYFVKDFFPCGPDCPEACEMGRKALQKIEELDHGVAEKYRKVLVKNVQMVVDYPEIIKAHAEGLSKRLAHYQEEARKAETKQE